MARGPCFYRGEHKWFIRNLIYLGGKPSPEPAPSSIGNKDP